MTAISVTEKPSNDHSVLFRKINDESNITSKLNEEEITKDMHTFFNEYYNERRNSSQPKPKWEEDDEGEFYENTKLTENEAISELMAQITDLQWTNKALMAIRYASSISTRADDENEQLFDAVREGNLGVVQKMLKNNKQVNMTDGEALSLLHWSAIEGNTRVGAYLLRNGAHINIKDMNGYTPLHYAAMCRQRVVVKLLVKWMADVMIENNAGQRPIDLTEDDYIKNILAEHEVTLN